MGAPRNGTEMTVDVELSNCGDPNVVDSNHKAADALEAAANGNSTSNLQTSDLVNHVALKFPRSKEKSGTRPGPSEGNFPPGHVAAISNMSDGEQNMDEAVTSELDRVVQEETDNICQPSPAHEKTKETSNPKASSLEKAPRLKRQRRESILDIEKKKAEAEAEKRKVLQQQELESSGKQIRRKSSAVIKAKVTYWLSGSSSQ